MSALRDMVAVVRNLTSSMFRLITASLKRRNNILNNFEQCLSEWRAGDAVSVTVRDPKWSEEIKS